MISFKFIKSSVIYTVAGALPMANAVLLLPFYLQYLPAGQYGALVLCLSFSVLIQLVVTYSFDASLYLHFHDYKEDRETLSRFVSSAFTFMLILGLGVVILMIVVGGPLFDYLYPDHTFRFFPYGIYSVFTGVSQAVFKVNNTFLQSREKPVLYLRSNLFNFALVAAFTIAGLKLWPGSLEGPVGGRMLAFFVSGIWALVRIYREYGMHFDFPLLRTTFAYNTYQSIYQFQLWMINYFDRVLMAFLIAMTALGVYDFTIKCLSVLDLVIAGIVNAFFPKILSQAAGQNIQGTSTEINKYYHGLTALIMMMVSATIFVLPILISWFVKKPGYQDAINYVPYASLVFLFRGMRNYFGLPYSTKKYSKPLPVIFAIVAIIKTALSWVLIREYGIYGAIAATVFAGGGEIILLWAWMKDRFKYVFNPFKLIGAPLLLLAFVIAFEPLLGNSYGWQLHVGYLILTAVMLLWFYRREIPKVWGSGRSDSKELLD